MSTSLRIGITDCGKFENYKRWIEAEEAVEVVKLSRLLKNADDADSCDGIVFSGGEDLHPELYGRPEYVADYGLHDIIPERDQFEYEVMAKAFTQKKPVLGICRGLQLANVFLGGSLVPDIPGLFRSHAHGKINGVDQTHLIEVEHGSTLEKITGQHSGMVNSAHHQSADEPAGVLKITAYSEPDIVEAMEWKDAADRSWLLLVQWHPERMTEAASPFTAAVKSAFLDACLGPGD